MGGPGVWPTLMKMKKFDFAALPSLATTRAVLPVRLGPRSAGPTGQTTDLLPQRYVHAIRTLSTNAPVIPPGLSALPSPN